jgi:hypothetical protein
MMELKIVTVNMTTGYEDVQRYEVTTQEEANEIMNGIGKDIFAEYTIKDDDGEVIDHCDFRNYLIINAVEKWDCENVKDLKVVLDVYVDYMATHDSIDTMQIKSDWLAAMLDKDVLPLGCGEIELETSGQYLATDRQGRYIYMDPTGEWEIHDGKAQVDSYLAHGETDSSKWWAEVLREAGVR